jgi:NhaP-type Na+/H+ or K+/H+ antiporter
MNYEFFIQILVGTLIGWVLGLYLMRLIYWRDK